MYFEKDYFIPRIGWTENEYCILGYFGDVIFFATLTQMLFIFILASLMFATGCNVGENIHECLL